MHSFYTSDHQTLRDVGKEFGLSHESVRQLFHRDGLAIKRARRQAPNTRTYTKKEKTRVRTLYKETGTIKIVVKRTGIPQEDVSEIVRDIPLRELYRRRGKTEPYKRSILIKALQDAATQSGEPLSRLWYREHAAKNHWPADLTQIRFFGSWPEACTAAGLTFNPVEGPRDDSITKEDCYLAMRQCAEEIERIPSYEIYTEWAKKRDVPSGPTVRAKHEGSWRKALPEAFEN